MITYRRQEQWWVEATWMLRRMRKQHQDRWQADHPYTRIYHLEHRQRLWTTHRQCLQCRVQRALESDRQRSTVEQEQHLIWHNAEPRRDAWDQVPLCIQWSGLRPRCQWREQVTRLSTTREREIYERQKCECVSVSYCSLMLKVFTKDYLTYMIINFN